MTMVKMNNNDLLHFVHDLMHDFDSLYEYQYKQPTCKYENWISLSDEELTVHLTEIFKYNIDYTEVLFDMVYEMDKFVTEQISEDGIICNQGLAPFLTLKGFQYYKNMEGERTACYSTILKSLFYQEDFNDWVDEATNFDFPTKELLKQGVKATYNNSTKGIANGVDYAYLDVISYLTEFFKSYDKHIAYCNDED